DFAQDHPPAFAYRLKYAVAAGMAILIIYVFKEIQVEHQQTERVLIASRPLLFVGSALQEVAPVHFAGQWVSPGEMPQCGFITFALAYIPKEPDATEIHSVVVMQAHRVTLKHPAVFQFEFAVLTGHGRV